MRQAKERARAWKRGKGGGNAGPGRAAAAVLALTVLAGCLAGPQEPAKPAATGQEDSALAPAGGGGEPQARAGVREAGGRGPAEAGAATERSGQDNERDAGERDAFFSETLFGLEEIGYRDIEDADAFFRDAAGRGVNAVGVDFVNLEDGATVFPSLALTRMGFELEDGGAARFLKILAAARRNRVRLIFMLESLAHAKTGFLEASEKIRREKITPQEVGALIREIAATTKEAGVQAAFNEEAFEEPFVEAAAEAAREHGIPYLRFFEDPACRPDMAVTEDYAYYPWNAFSDEKDRAYLEENRASGAYYGQLGNGNLVLAFARACGQRSGVLTAGGWGLGDATHQNLALLRHLVFGGDAFFFVLATHADGSYSQKEKAYVDAYDFGRLRELLARYPRGRESPRKANLVLATVDEESDLADFYNNALLSSSSAVTQALLAAGYALYATQGRVLEDADAYYLFLPGSIYAGEGDDAADFPAFALKALESGKPVFVQVAAAVPDTPNWRRALALLGLEGYRVEAVFEPGKPSPIPLKAKSPFKEGAKEIPYRGYVFEPWDPQAGEAYALGHAVLVPESGGFETVLESPAGLPLVTRHENRFFVNGGYLHLAAAGALANALAAANGEPPVYRAPSYGYFARTPGYAVFFAPYGTEVDVAVGGRAESVDVFDKEGKAVEGGVAVEDGRLKGRVEKFQLVVVRKKAGAKST